MIHEITISASTIIIVSSFARFLYNLAPYNNVLGKSLISSEISTETNLRDPQPLLTRTKGADAQRNTLQDTNSSCSRAWKKGNSLMTPSRIVLATRMKRIASVTLYSGKGARISRSIVCKALAFVLLISAAALGQSPQENGVQETWQGFVVSSDIHRSYSLAVFGMAELESPRMFRDSEYFAGLRISRTLSNSSRLGIEYLQDRAYLNHSRLFLENRGSIDFLRRWQTSPTTTLYLQPKLELRSFAGTFDQRLKLHGEALRKVSAVRGTARVFLEPAFDRNFHGFERAIIHTGVIWPARARVKIEFFNSITIARRPEHDVEAIGVLAFIQLRNQGKGPGEISH